MTQITVRLRRLLGELGYAQRRVLELQTGVAFTGRRELSRPHRRQISELESLWQAGGSTSPCEL
jgi:hypothetical protein